MAAVKAVHVPSFKSIDKLIELVSSPSGILKVWENTEVISQKTE